MWHWSCFFFLLAKVREETLDKIKNTCRFRFCEMKPEKKIQIYYFFQGVRRVRERCAISRKKVQGFEIRWEIILNNLGKFCFIDDGGIKVV